MERILTLNKIRELSNYGKLLNINDNVLLDFEYKYVDIFKRMIINDYHDRISIEEIIKLL